MADRGRPVEPIVTDHALIRYIKRVHCLDLQPIRDEISNATRDAIACKASGVKHPSGFTFKIIGNTVVTVQPTSRGKRHG